MGQHGKKLGWLLIAAAFLTPFFIPLHFSLDAAAWQKLMDAGHVPAFAMLALFLAWRLGGREPVGAHFAVAFAGATLIGCGVEMAQGWTGREASLNDMLNSTAGAFIGSAGWYAWQRGTGWRVATMLYAALVCAAALLPAWRLWGGIAWREANFPVLADFEDQSEFRMWRAVIQNDNPYGSRVSLSREHVAHGVQSARIAIGAVGGYPGTRFYLAAQDWRGYRELAFDVYNPADAFDLSLRVDDDLPAPRHDDRYNGSLRIAPGWNWVSIPLAEIEHGARNRPLNMDKIRRLIFFIDHPPKARVFFLDWVRLK